MTKTIRLTGDVPRPVTLNSETPPEFQHTVTIKDANGRRYLVAFADAKAADEFRALIQRIGPTRLTTIHKLD
jgi:hypothetical protein